MGPIDRSMELTGVELRRTLDETAEMCEEVGLPKDTLCKATFSFAITTVLSLLITANPITAISLGTVAAIASIIFAISISVLRVSFKAETIHPIFNAVLIAGSILGACFLGMTFLPVAFNPFSIGMIIYIMANIIATSIANNNNSLRQPTNRSIYCFI